MKFATQCGEVSERLKAHAWKACIGHFYSTGLSRVRFLCLEHNKTPKTPEGENTGRILSIPFSKHSTFNYLSFFAYLALHYGPVPRKTLALLQLLGSPQPCPASFCVKITYLMTSSFPCMNIFKKQPQGVRLQCFLVFKHKYL